ncbi:iron-containing alcohol dehydrogenase [Aquabacterium sp. OR-4]|uniref:iron-containing alcohol dehydrogenase n=1 Tax=Aquabacterium sp. OR-4 TaxID=2978127 RepID=UPI0021B44684|nr:iron-containing alcohol dehydrogenase [Aquabacterium sp. OR-4]MDT7838500.1 iron-containing alcohol dehydrogenase [Aquabacterium sp. OR-4]
MFPELISDMARSLGLPRLKRAAGVVTKRVPIPQPLLLVGAGASARLGQAIAAFGHRKLLLVTDAEVARLGLAQALCEALAAAGVPLVVFDAVRADAPVADVEAGVTCYLGEGCDGIVAVGGGSVMDAAKVIGLAAANGRPPAELVGYFKGQHGPPPLYAVPTTAGTGSEVTVAAVISEPGEPGNPGAGGRKRVVADTRIVPEMAALDPLLMVGLPPAVTAATGIDALTHAIEASISQWATPHTSRLARAAVVLIWRWLKPAFDDGRQLQAREQMALASTWAGLAFTRASVGNVHAIAHQLGGRYHTPHGLANALMLPAVLRFCQAEAAAPLAALARAVGLDDGVNDGHDTEATLALRFIDGVQALCDAVAIPRTLAALREADIPALARAACWEADTQYPVPRRMTQLACEALLRSVLPPATPPATPHATKRPPARKAAAKTAGTPARRRAPAADKG